MEKICQEEDGLRNWLGEATYSLPQVVSSAAQSCPTLCDPVGCSTPGFPSITNCWSLLKLMSVMLVIKSKHLILCCPLLLLPSIFPSIRVFSNELALWIRWPNLIYSWNWGAKILRDTSDLGM